MFAVVAFVGMFGFSFERLHGTFNPSPYFESASGAPTGRQKRQKVEKASHQVVSMRWHSVCLFPAAISAISTVSSLRNWKVLQHLSSPGEEVHGLFGRWLCSGRSFFKPGQLWQIVPVADQRLRWVNGGSTQLHRSTAILLRWMMSKLNEIVFGIWICVALKRDMA